MKKIFWIIYSLFAFNVVYAIQPFEPNYKVKGDSIYFENGNSLAIIDYLKDHPEEQKYIEQKKLNQSYVEEHKNENYIKNQNDSHKIKSNKTKKEYQFDKSWKFYFVIIIFPVILIFFILLYFKSRKKD